MVSRGSSTPWILPLLFQVSEWNDTDKTDETCVSKVDLFIFEVNFLFYSTLITCAVIQALLPCIPSGLTVRPILYSYEHSRTCHCNSIIPGYTVLSKHCKFLAKQPTTTSHLQKVADKSSRPCPLLLNNHLLIHYLET